MSDDPIKVDFSEFGRTPRARKTRQQANEDDGLSPGRQAAAKVADSTKLDKKSVEELAEMAIRRAANVVLLGGDDFLPTTLKEASDVAKIWASVASMERARLAGKGSALAEDDPVVKMQFQSELDRLRKRGTKAE